MKFKFAIRETIVKTVTIDAESPDEAYDLVQDLYYGDDADVLPVESTAFDGASFNPTCSICGSEFEDFDHLESIIDESGSEILACNRCIRNMKGVERNE